MSEDEEWSYDVGEIDDEAAPADQQAAESADAPVEADDPDEEGGWRFAVSDLEEDDEDEDEDDDDGWLGLTGTVEAGSPELENVVFVLLGLALGVVVVVQLFF